MNMFGHHGFDIKDETFGYRDFVDGSRRMSIFLLLLFTLCTGFCVCQAIRGLYDKTYIACNESGLDMPDICLGESWSLGKDMFGFSMDRVHVPYSEIRDLSLILKQRSKHRIRGTILYEESHGIYILHFNDHEGRVYEISLADFKDDVEMELFLECLEAHGGLP